MLNKMFWYSWDSKHSNIVEDNKNYIWLPTQGNSLTQAHKYSCKTKGYPQNVIRSNLRCQLMTAMNKNERGFLSSVAFNLVEEESQFRLGGQYRPSTSLWLQECWNIYTLYQFVSFQQFQIREGVHRKRFLNGHCPDRSCKGQRATWSFFSAVKNDI